MGRMGWDGGSRHGESVTMSRSLGRRLAVGRGRDCEIKLPTGKLEKDEKQDTLTEKGG
jgi:hypothetical protein